MRKRILVTAFFFAGSTVFFGCASAPPEMQILPPSVTLATGSSMYFSVAGPAAGPVNWSVAGIAGGNATVGTITPTGIYKAPAKAPSEDPVTVLATSVANHEVTASAQVSVINPPPVLSSISPSAVMAGTGSATVTLYGKRFLPESKVLEISNISGVSRSIKATFVSENQMSAQIPATLTASVTLAKLQVQNPDPDGGVTAALPFAVISPGSISGTQNPLVAKYSIDVPSAASVAVQFGPDTSYGRVTSPVAVQQGSKPVSLFVAGMRASSTYHMRAVITLPDGSTYYDADHLFTTGQVPADHLPDVKVTQPSGMVPSSGVELLDLFDALTATQPWFDKELKADVYDLQGHLIWYYDVGSGFSPFPIKRLPNGDFLLVANTGAWITPQVSEVREIDLADDILYQLSAKELNAKLAAAGFSLKVNSFNHDILILPNGHWILLATDSKKFTDLPGYPGTTTVLGNALVDLDQNHNPVWVWNTFDHLNVNRHPMRFPDWTHANAVIYSPDDGDLIFSMRHQYWVIKIDYSDGHGNGDILWKLGPGGSFSIPGGVPPDWNYAQHYPYLAGPGSAGVFSLGMFDNGNNRVMDTQGDVCGTTGQPPCYSRPVIFQLDETNKTAHILWQDKLPVFSNCCGNMEILANSDIEFDASRYNPGLSRVEEVTRVAPHQLVWQMDIHNILAYRAYRIPSLYPGVIWKH